MPHLVMESLRLFLIFLCLAGVRSRMVPDATPAPEAAAAAAAPESGAARQAPGASPTQEPAAAPEASRKPHRRPAASPSPSKGLSVEGINAVLSKSPDKSTAELVEEIDVPSAKEMAKGVNISAALNSVDDNTLKTISSLF